MYHALRAAETCARYIADAERRDDGELAEFCREVQAQNSAIARGARVLLRDRLDI
jgi:hypothetical protein